MSPPRRFQGSSAAKEAAQPGPFPGPGPKAPPGPQSDQPGSPRKHRPSTARCAGSPPACGTKEPLAKGRAAARPSERQGSTGPAGLPGFVRAQGREGLRTPAHLTDARRARSCGRRRPLAPPSPLRGAHSFVGRWGCADCRPRLTLLLTSTAAVVEAQGHRDLLETPVHGSGPVALASLALRYGDCRRAWVRHPPPWPRPRPRRRPLPALARPRGSSEVQRPEQGWPRALGTQGAAREERGTAPGTPPPDTLEPTSRPEPGGSATNPCPAPRSPAPGPRPGPRAPVPRGPPRSPEDPPHEPQGPRPARRPVNPPLIRFPKDWPGAENRLTSRGLAPRASRPSLAP